MHTTVSELGECSYSSDVGKLIAFNVHTGKEERLKLVIHYLTQKIRKWKISKIQISIEYNNLEQKSIEIENRHTTGETKLEFSYQKILIIDWWEKI